MGDESSLMMHKYEDEDDGQYDDDNNDDDDEYDDDEARESRTRSRLLKYLQIATAAALQLSTTLHQ